MSSAITRGTPGDQDIFDRMLHSQRTGSSEKGQEPAFPDGHGDRPRRLLGPQHQKPFQEKRDILALTAPHPLTADYVTFQSSGIKKGSDLPGKRFVAGGRGGSIFIVTRNFFALQREV